MIDFTPNLNLTQYLCFVVEVAKYWHFFQHPSCKRIRQKILENKNISSSDNFQDYAHQGQFFMQVDLLKIYYKLYLRKWRGNNKRHEIEIMTSSESANAIETMHFEVVCFRGI